MSKKHHYPAGPCLNCGTPLQGGWEFCPQCGQKNEELKLPLSHVLEELAEGIWHFDSKLWATLKAIVTRPGKITAEFLDGHRVRYVPPIRLYVFISFVFFFAASVMQHHREEAQLHHKRVREREAPGDFSIRIGDEGDAVVKATRTDDLRTNRLDSISGVLGAEVDKGVIVAAFPEPGGKDRPTLRMQRQLADSALVAYERQNHILPDSDRAFILKDMASRADTVVLRPLSDGRKLALRFPSFGHGLVLDTATVDTLVHGTDAEREHLFTRTHINGWWRRLGAARAARLLELGRKGEDPTDMAEFWHLMFKAASIGMFLFMPLAAFFLWLLFRHQRRFYVEHLIHALHLHAIAFLVILLLEFLPAILFPTVDSGWLDGLTSLLILIYPFLSIKRVYRQRLRRTLFKYILWVVLYGVLMILFLGAVFLYSFATL